MAPIFNRLTRKNSGAGYADLGGHGTNRDRVGRTPAARVADYRGETSASPGRDALQNRTRIMPQKAPTILGVAVAGLANQLALVKGWQPASHATSRSRERDPRLPQRVTAC
jgi:hypothetical protein